MKVMIEVLDMKIGPEETLWAKPFTMCDNVVFGIFDDICFGSKNINNFFIKKIQKCYSNKNNLVSFGMKIK